MLGAILTIQIRKRRRNRVMVVEVCYCIDWLIELASIQKQKSPVRGFLMIGLFEVVNFDHESINTSALFKLYFLLVAKSYRVILLIDTFKTGSQIHRA
jgi:hypothetical protein